MPLLRMDPNNITKKSKAVEMAMRPYDKKRPSLRWRFFRLSATRSRAMVGDNVCGSWSVVIGLDILVILLLISLHHSKRDHIQSQGDKDQC